MVLSDLAVGSLVKDPDTKYNGDVLIWRILEHGHTGDPEGSTALESLYIISTKAFDASEPSNPNTSIAENGNSQYRYSNILQWLNSDADDWYTPQHTYDEAPASSYVRNCNPYESESGFLTNMSRPLKDALLTVTKPVSVGSFGENVENVSSKIFLLSRIEVYSYTTYGVEGFPYSYYARTTAYSRRYKDYLNYAAKGQFPNEVVGSWWVRSPSSVGSNFLCNPAESTTLEDYSDCYSNFAGVHGGIVPAFCIRSSTRIDTNPDSAGVYALDLNPVVKKIYIGNSNNQAVQIL